MVRNEEVPPIGGFARVFASTVRALVNAAGISGSELARRMGRAQSYVSLRLNGRKAWTLDELDQIASILGISVGELFDKARDQD